MGLVPSDTALTGRTFHSTISYSSKCEELFCDIQENLKGKQDRSRGRRCFFNDFNPFHVYDGWDLNAVYNTIRMPKLTIIWWAAE
uniref:Uncharacterized protein n=1 Tax=Romanomermis culicivorax TaxID=13658 RepID=A0A915KI20_ROMCU